MSSKLVYSGLLALSQLHNDQPGDAYKTMRRTVAYMQRCEPTAYFTIVCYQGVVEVLVKLLQTDDAVIKTLSSGMTRAKLTAEMTAALDVLYEFDQTFVISTPRSLLWKGVHEAWRGKRAKSDAKLAEAAYTAKQLGCVRCVLFSCEFEQAKGNERERETNFFCQPTAWNMTKQL